jgi:hypothetical protein
MIYDALGMLPERAFQRDARGQINPQGPSGGGGATSSTVYQTSFPKQLEPQLEELVGRGMGIMQGELDRGYQPYQDQRFAGFSPMQAQAFQNIAGMQVAPQLADASNMAYGSGQAALGFGQQASDLGYRAGDFGTTAGNIGLGGLAGAQEAQRAAEMQADVYGQSGLAAGLRGESIGARGASAAEQGFGAQQAYQQMATDPSQMQSYMSPYMQNVVDVQQQEAIRQADIQRQSQQAQAVGQGAFGGSRQGVVEAELQRNLGTQLGRIQAEGQQRAFEQAQQAQQFGAGLGIQGLQAGVQGLQAGMQGTGQAMTGAGLGLQGTGQRLAAGQLGLQGAQTGIAGQQAGIQGIQTGISGQQAGIAGAQTGIGAAGQLGSLGAQQYQQQMGITDAMQKYGALQQSQQQQALDAQYQEEMAARNFPYQQVGWMSDILRGMPSAQSSQTMYGAQPNQMAQLLGGAGAIYAGANMKEGGQVKHYANGGGVSAEGLNIEEARALPSRLKRLSDSQLAAYARVVKDAITLSAVQTEVDRRAKMRQPGAQMPEDTTAAEVAKRAEQASLGGPIGMAGGGIVALRGGGQLNFQDLPIYEPPSRAEGMVDTPISGLLKRGIQALPRGGAELRIDPVTQQPVSLGQFMRLQEQRAAQKAQTSPPVSVVAAQDPRGIPDQIPSPGPMDISDQVPAPTAPAETIPPSNVGLDQLRDRGQQQMAPASSAGQIPTTWDEYRKMASTVQMSPENQSLLSDMQERLSKKFSVAESQSDAAKYEAIMMASLAMMSGTSLADGIAKAAQVGGATYMSSKKEARKALSAAEDAEIDFRKYQIALDKGERDSAEKSLNNFMDNILKLKQIDATNARTAALGGDAASNKLLTQARLIEARMDAAKDKVANQPKFKGELTALEEQRKTYNKLTPQSEARFNTIVKEIETEAAERNKELQNQLDSIYGKITGDSGGLKYLGPKASQ